MPRCTVIPVVVDDGTSITCTCSGQTGDTAHIDATCATTPAAGLLFLTRLHEHALDDELLLVRRVGGVLADRRGHEGLPGFLLERPGDGPQRHRRKGHVYAARRPSTTRRRAPLAALATALLFGLIGMCRPA